MFFPYLVNASFYYFKVQINTFSILASNHNECNNPKVWTSWINIVPALKIIITKDFNKMMCFAPVQMGLASVAHLYVFPAKAYEQVANLKLRNVSVLGDYASVDCPVDPEEVRDSTRPAKPKHPQPELEERYATSVKSSIWDFLFGGGQYVSFFYSQFF